MISFRQHLVSLVAVFVALAVGIALGAGLLDRTVEQADDTAPAAGTGVLETRAGYGDDFAEAASARLYGDGLEGRQVSLVTLPGAGADAVTALTERVEDAGAEIAGRYDARETMVAPGEQSLVDSLGTQLIDELDTDAVPTDLPSHERLGRLLGLAIATTDTDGAAVDADGGTVLTTLRSGGLLSEGEEATGRAPLVLVVLGAERGDPDALAQEAALVRGLAEMSAGTVLVGSTQSGRDGDLRSLRDDNDLGTASSVDGADTTVGQVTTALTLARALSGEPGSFGASGADGAVPLG